VLSSGHYVPSTPSHAAIGTGKETSPGGTGLHAPTSAQDADLFLKGACVD
jgi:hypothetical protein